MTEEHTKDELMDANVEIQLWMVEIMTMANQMRVNRIPDLSWLGTMTQTLASALPIGGRELLHSLKKVEDCTLAYQVACLEMLKQAEKLAKTMRTGYVCMMRESTDQPVTEIPVESDPDVLTVKEIPSFETAEEFAAYLRREGWTRKKFLVATSCGGFRGLTGEDAQEITEELRKMEEEE